MEYKVIIHSGLDSQTTELQRFYKKNGHKGKIQHSDTCLSLMLDKKIIAAVRLSPSPSSDGQYVLLKGLWVKREMRRTGLGSLLLQKTTQYLESTQQTCYCLAYKHLETFYRLHCFNIESEDSAPTFLWQRYQRYNSQGKELILMKLHS